MGDPATRTWIEPSISVGGSAVPVTDTGRRYVPSDRSRTPLRSTDRTVASCLVMRTSTAPAGAVAGWVPVKAISKLFTVPAVTVKVSDAWDQVIDFGGGLAARATSAPVPTNPAAAMATTTAATEAKRFSAMNPPQRWTAAADLVTSPDDHWAC